MSSSSMMYNVWSKNRENKVYRMMARKYGAMDYPGVEHHKNAASTGIEHPYLEHVKNQLDPRRSLGRINNTYYSTPQDATTYLSVGYPFMHKYPMDYPDYYFHESNNPLIMHFRAPSERYIHPKETIQNYQPHHKVLDLGNLDYLNGDDRQRSLREIHNFVINQLAKKAALIMSGMHPGGPGSHFSPAADFFEENEDRLPKYLREAKEIHPHLADLPTSVAAIAHELGHQHRGFINNIPSENYPDLAYHVRTGLNNQTDNKYTTFLRMLHQGLVGAND